MSVPKLPVSNRSLAIGAAVFLFVSAVYKSGLIGLIIRMKAERLLSERAVGLASPVVVADVAQGSSASLLDGIPLSQYESSMAEMSHLRERVGELEARRSDFRTQCTLADEAFEERVASVSSKLNECSRELRAANAQKAECEINCKESLNELEMEHIQIMEKLEMDFSANLNNVLAVKNSEAEELGAKVQSLVSENSELRTSADQLTLLALSEREEFTRLLEELNDDARVKSGGTSDQSIVDSMDVSLTVWYAAVSVLTVLVALLSITSLVLFQERRHRQQSHASTVPLRVTETVYTPISSPALPEISAYVDTEMEEPERISMSVEDLRAAMAREVQAQVEIIEKHHEEELARMHEIIRETRTLNLELRRVMKDVVDETSIVSTNNNSPSLSALNDEEVSHDAISFDRGTPGKGDDLDVSSLSALLETSVTPIRVALGSRVLVKTTPSVPTCYSIASPRRRAARALMGSDSSSSNGEDWSDVDESEEKENLEKDMRTIWSNFGGEGEGEGQDKS